MNFVNEESFGKDLRIIKTLSLARSIANDPHPILITGESGVGKESLCKFIHENSGRSTNQCLVVDCARSEVDVENDILGHRDEMNGRFNKGVLERANNGTIIFKNVEGLTEGFQKKLHRILLELLDYDIKVKILICTTKNLSKLVGAGRFYRALFLYLSYHQISLIPLRERKDDIHFLADLYLEDFARIVGTLKPLINEEALDKLKTFYWPHNLEELKLVLENTTKELKGMEIGVDDLVLGEKKTSSNLYDSDDDGLKLMSLKDAERLLIRKALIHTSENRTQAAKILGVSIRTLRNKINEYRNDGSNFFVNLR